MAQDGQTSINIPQLLAVAVVGFFAFRWFMSKPTTPTSGPSSSRTRPVDPAKVEAVSAMFPQLDRRSIAWDLQRNGGNVEATAQRVLDGRGLDNPPPTFQPNLPSPAPTTGSSSGSSAQQPTPSQQDLISRYGLQNKVHGKGKEPVPSEEQKRNAWSSDKNARAEALKQRREEMILAARRKLMEKEGGVQA